MSNESTDPRYHYLVEVDGDSPEAMKTRAEADDFADESIAGLPQSDGEWQGEWVRMYKLVKEWELQPASGPDDEKEYSEMQVVYEDDDDPPVCRLQFPDGSVPANAREAAEGWKACYDKKCELLAITLEMLKAERAEWNDFAGIKRPEGSAPLSPKDARLMREIFRPVSEPAVPPAASRRAVGG